MATFRELLTSVSPEQLVPELERIVGDRWSVDSLAFYLQSIDQMLASSPLPEERRAGVLVVKVVSRPDWGDGEWDVEVSIREADGIEYGVDLIPWTDLLDIPVETTLDPITTAAEILAEMTFWGSPEEQAETVKMLHQRIAAADADPNRALSAEEFEEELKKRGL